MIANSNEIAGRKRVYSGDGGHSGSSRKCGAASGRDVAPSIIPPESNSAVGSHPVKTLTIFEFVKSAPSLRDYSATKEAQRCYSFPAAQKTPSAYNNNIFLSGAGGTERRPSSQTSTSTSSNPTEVSSTNSSCRYVADDGFSIGSLSMFSQQLAKNVRTLQNTSKLAQASSTNLSNSNLAGLLHDLSSFIRSQPFPPHTQSVLPVAAVAVSTTQDYSLEEMEAADNLSRLGGEANGQLSASAGGIVWRSEQYRWTDLSYRYKNAAVKTTYGTTDANSHLFTKSDLEEYVLYGNHIVVYCVEMEKFFGTGTREVTEGGHRRDSDYERKRNALARCSPPIAMPASILPKDEVRMGDLNALGFKKNDVRLTKKAMLCGHASRVPIYCYKCYCILRKFAPHLSPDECKVEARVCYKLDCYIDHCKNGLKHCQSCGDDAKLLSTFSE